MHTHQNRLISAGNVTADQGEMAFSAIHFALVSDHAKFTIRGRDDALRYAIDVALVLQPVANKLGDREHLHAVFFAEFNEIGNAGHGAIVVHDFADHAGGNESSKAREID